ncbi:hypothetical protein K502DRAFT_329988 [Neoconidiobolus thromboides FSU 785]|nr:hypothetical protein K502DRAFT_329988 [Neoconidiobolus thromboides FSU 785]
MGQLIYNSSLYDTMKEIELKDQIQNIKKIQQFYESSVFIHHLNAFANLVLVYLHYSFVLVISKLKRFSINKAMVSYKSAQPVAEFFLIIKRNNIQQSHDKNGGTFGRIGCDLTINDGFQMGYGVLYYTLLMYVVYVYLSFIDREEWLLNRGFGKKLIIEAKAYILKLLMASYDLKVGFGQYYQVY